MRIVLLVVLALFSCNKKTVKLEVVPAPVAKTIVDEHKPLFKLGSVFEGEKSTTVERKSVIMPCYRPEVGKIVRASIRVDTVLCVDTVINTTVVHDTIYVEVFNDKGALIMLVWMIMFCIFCFVYGLYVGTYRKVKK